MNKISVFFREKENDSESASVRKDIESDLGIKLDFLKIVHSYLIDAELNQEETELIAKKLFSDPIVQEYRINEKTGIESDWAIEVKLHADVTDNEGNASVKGVQDLIKRKLNENQSIRTSKEFFVSGADESQIKRICSEMLANNVIESFNYRKND